MLYDNDLYASNYEECPFEYVNQFDTPSCDMEPGSDTRRFREDFLNEPFFWDE